MRIFFKIILITLLIFTASTIGQNTNREMLEEKRFSELLKRAKANIAKTKETQKRATQKASTMVSKTKTKIVSLNTNVKELKTDLNETSKKLNYVTDTNAGVKFILLPISDTQKIKW
jgi:septal ring factor EnvC (AmiA/AmiB activator)